MRGGRAGLTQATQGSERRTPGVSELGEDQLEDETDSLMREERIIEGYVNRKQINLSHPVTSRLMGQLRISGDPS